MTSMYKTEIHSTFTITTFQTKSENYQKMFWNASEKNVQKYKQYYKQVIYKHYWQCLVLEQRLATHNIYYLEQDSRFVEQINVYSNIHSYKV